MRSVPVTIESILCTPVKGTRLSRPRSVNVTDGGIADDRRFHVVHGDGRQYRTSPRLLVIRSHYDATTDALKITLPDGRSARATVQLGDEIDATISWDHGRSMPSREVRGPFAGLLSEHLGESVCLARPCRPSGAVDVEPLTLLSAASVRRVERQLDGQQLGVERFRMNINIDGVHEHAEDGWYGRQLVIGDVRLRVLEPVPRCAVTTYDPSTGRRDAGTLMAIVQYRREVQVPGSGTVVTAPMGVYARVERPGTIAVGQCIAVE